MLRRARPAEAEALAGLWLRSRRAAAGVPRTPRSDDEVRAWFADSVLPSQEVWVAEAGGGPIALMVLAGEWIEQLYVDPDHQRAGHGAALVRLAQAERSTLALWTFLANARARAFYESLGFRRSGPASTANEERAPAVVYRWTRT